MTEANPIARRLSAPARLAAIAAGWWLVAFSLLTCLEIVLRRGFGTSLQAVDEIGAYSLAIVSALAFSQALLKKGHTRVDFLLGALPLWLRAPLHAIAYALLAAAAAFGAYRGWFVLSESIEFDSHANTPLRTPLWIPQSAWLAGMLLFACTSAALALHALALLFRGAWRRLDALYGPMTLEEEVEQELGAAVGKLPR
jgi:TRAP-type C4-dicarboxylate transport system permease small subunit